MCNTSIQSVITDDCGVEYSTDGKIMSHFTGNIGEYKIKKGTVAVRAAALAENCKGHGMSNITLPNSTIAIGERAF